MNIDNFDYKIGDYVVSPRFIIEDPVFGDSTPTIIDLSDLEQL